MIQPLQKTSAVLTLIVAVACCIATRAAAQITDGDGLAAIRVRMVRLENSLHKAQAIHDIKRLQYSYAHYAELGLWYDLGDLFATNGVAHYAQGDFRGPESLRKFYLQELGRGQLGLAGREAGGETQHRFSAGPATYGSIWHLSQDVLPTGALHQPGDPFAGPISCRHRGKC